MTDVQDVYAQFLLALDTKDKLKISRRFLPFLKGKGRQFLLMKIAARPNLLWDFDFTTEEFALLEPEKYAKILLDALLRERFELAYAVGKATGKYGICCRFALDTPPREILEVLNQNLEGKNIATCFIQKADLKEMLYYGLVPCPYIEDTAKTIWGDDYLKVLEYHQQGLTEEEIEYWTGIEDSYDYLCKVGFWSLVSKDYCEEAAKVGSSYPAFLIFPNMLYASQRPKTNMSMFETSVSHRYSTEVELPPKRIAVTRYTKGMSKGLFYDERPKDICGYFFYAEPESTTFLAYNSALTAFNKTEAAEKLLALAEDAALSSVLKRLSFNENTQRKEKIIEHISGKLPADLLFTVDTTGDLLLRDTGVELSDDLLNSNTKVYMGKEIELYAYEDDLDQPLCLAAARLGYDIVILEHMVGSHQVVTEVLDTREDSLKHLWFKD